MKIERPGCNMTVVKLKNGLELFYSYETCVGGWDGSGAFKTEKFWSRTTNKHLSKYFGGVTPREVAQDYCDALGA